MTTVQIIGGGTQMNIFFCLGCLLILIGILTVETAEWTKTAKTSVSASGIAITSGACSGISRGTHFFFFHNLLVSLLDFFEFGFCLIFIWIVDIGIRMINTA